MSLYKIKYKQEHSENTKDLFVGEISEEGAKEAFERIYPTRELVQCTKIKD